MLSGRVKSLNPIVHGGILAQRDLDQAEIAQKNIKLIDLVIVNLYPFSETIANPKVTLEEAIENIDIGGPTMIRASAKNFSWVTVVVDTKDYNDIISELKVNNGISYDTRLKLAAKAFSLTSSYEDNIANFMGAININGERKEFSNTFNQQYHLKQILRYGENPHQNAAFYTEEQINPSSISGAIQIQGKELSFNNIADGDAALECVKSLEHNFGCVIVKHANPCGVATGTSSLDAYNKAYSTDKLSAFGGIIAFNSTVDHICVENIFNQQFVEVIIAPDYTKDAIELAKSKPNIRLLKYINKPEANNNIKINNLDLNFDLKRVSGGLLVQTFDKNLITKSNLKVVTKRAPTEQEWEDLLFCWNVVRFVKSNAIVYAKNGQTLGIGAGQMSRVFSANIAAQKALEAKFDLTGSAMASDAFFPFRDGIDQAHNHKISCIIQPGGSIRDSDIIHAANEFNMAMVFTGVRHFRH